MLFKETIETLLFLIVKNRIIPKVSSKRQITIPIDQCHSLGIEPGDEVECFVVDGQLTLVKKSKGAAQGLLGHILSDKVMSDEASMQSAIE